MIYVLLIKNDCTGKEVGRWALGQFENGDADKALTLAKANWEAYGKNVIQCPDTRPQYRVWAYFGSSTAVDMFLFTDGKQYPRTVLRVTLETDVNPPNCDKGPRTKLKEFPEDQLTQATDAAKSYWTNYRPYKQPCWVQGPGGPVLTEVNKYDVRVYRFTDGQYADVPIYSALHDSPGGTGGTKTSTGDDTAPPADIVPATTGPSGWQVLGAVGLAGIVGYGAWKMTDVLLEKGPSRRPATNPSLADTERARKIVKLAVKKTKVRSVKHWLEFDEYGTWEKEALHLIENTAEKAKAAGWNDAAVDDQIATYLTFLALEATLGDAKKRAKK